MKKNPSLIKLVLVVYFRKFELPSKLMGEHNKENIGAAVAVAKIVGVKKRRIGAGEARHAEDVVQDGRGAEYAGLGAGGWGD